MYSFLRRPAWVVLHIVVIAITVTFLMLGRWQLSRLEERQAENAIIGERLGAEPTEWLVSSEVIPPEYTRLNLAGSLLTEEEVLLRSQVHLGQPGFDVLTPLYLEGASAILINRGWVPFEFDTPPVAVASPPEDHALISGYVRYPLEGAWADSLEGNRAEVVASVDLEQLDQQIEADLEMFYVVLTAMEPAGASLPIIDGVPVLTDGPHLSYAVQWFAFALVGSVGYAALVRSTARRRSGLSRRGERRPPDPS